MTDRIHTKKLTEAATLLGQASTQLRSAVLAATSVQEEAAAAAIKELEATTAVLTDVVKNA